MVDKGQSYDMMRVEMKKDFPKKMQVGDGWKVERQVEQESVNLELARLLMKQVLNPLNRLEVKVISERTMQ